MKLINKIKSSRNRTQIWSKFNRWDPRLLMSWTIWLKILINSSCLLSSFVNSTVLRETKTTTQTSSWIWKKSRSHKSGRTLFTQTNASNFQVKARTKCLLTNALGLRWIVDHRSTSTLFVTTTTTETLCRMKVFLARTHLTSMVKHSSMCQPSHRSTRRLKANIDQLLSNSSWPNTVSSSAETSKLDKRSARLDSWQTAKLTWPTISSWSGVTSLTLNGTIQSATCSLWTHLTRMDVSPFNCHTDSNKLVWCPQSRTLKLSLGWKPPLSRPKTTMMRSKFSGRSLKLLILSETEYLNF